MGMFDGRHIRNFKYTHFVTEMNAAKAKASNAFFNMAQNFFWKRGDDNYQYIVRELPFGFSTPLKVVKMHDLNSKVNEFPEK